MTISGAHELIRQDLARTAANLDWSSVHRVLAAIQTADRMFVMARGRSELVLKMFAMRLMHMGREVHVVGDVTTPSVAVGDLVIVASASGETETVCRLAERAKAAGASLVGFVGTAGSRLTKSLDAFVAVNAPSMREPGQHQFGGSLFEQSVLLLCDAIVVAELFANPELSAKMSARHANLE